MLVKMPNSLAAKKYISSATVLFVLLKRIDIFIQIQGCEYI